MPTGYVFLLAMERRGNHFRMTKPHFRVKQILPPKHDIIPYQTFQTTTSKRTVKNCQANKFSKTTVAIRFNLQVCSSVPPLNCYYIFSGSSHHLNFDKFRDVAPLEYGLYVTFFARLRGPGGTLGIFG